MGVLGALQTGISWDEPYHVMRLNNYFDHGWFAVDWAVEGDGSTASDANTVVYGPIAMLLLHGLTPLVGGEGWDAVATSPAAYDVRHLGVVLIGRVGTAAAATITRILLGSWRWALFTAAALLDVEAGMKEKSAEFIKLGGTVYVGSEPAAVADG